jgi:formate dehydrogenase subunit gamma
MLDSPPTLHPRLDEIIAAHLPLEGPLLPILHAVQAEWGFVPDAAQPVIAAALNLSKAEVHGVVSFYHDFRETPTARQVVRICRAEACQAMGGVALAEAVAARLGAGFHDTTADGAVAVEPVFCLGLCACAPAAQVDGRLIGRATPEAIVAALKGDRA